MNAIDKQTRRITLLAGELISRYNFGWLQRQLGMKSTQLKRAMFNHEWTHEQATVINRYHEMLIVDREEVAA